MTVINSWTPAMVATLRALHRGGGSFIEIAAQMSAIFKIELSRNACIGKARRLELPMRADDGPRKTLPRPAKPVKLPVPVAAPIPPPPEPEPVEGEGISIYQLNGTTCRWPLGPVETVPPYQYCGGHCDVEVPYCAEHSVKARGSTYVPRKHA